MNTGVTEDPRSWRQRAIEAIRALAAVLAVGRFILWVARWFSGDPS